MTMGHTFLAITTLLLAPLAALHTADTTPTSPKGNTTC